MISTLPVRQRGRLMALASWATPVIALAAYLAFWPVPIQPRAWQPPADAGHTGAHAANTRLANLQTWPLAEGQHGPEHILATPDALYTGLDNGDVLKLSLDGRTRELVANTGGRPLGLDLDPQGRLLVADAMRGLLRVTGSGPQAQVETLLDRVQHPGPDDPVRYADAVKVDARGTIWLTDASRRFGAKAVGSTFEASVLDILEHSCSGRLIALDPALGVARVALQGLCFPNGLAFSRDGRSLFLSETGTYRILKVDLAKLSLVRTGAGDNGVPTLDDALRQQAATVLIDNLPGFPDNLTAGEGGRIWVGLTKPRSPVIDAGGPQPFIRAFTLRLPRSMWPVPKPYGHVLAFDEQGRIVDDLQDPDGGYPETTAATESGGRLIVQSLHAGAIGWMPYSGPAAR